MTDTIDQRKTGCARPRGIDLGRPGIGHWHPQVEAKEGDNGTDSGKRKVAGCKHRDQNATDDREYGGDRQPDLSLQALNEEKGEDGGGDKAKGSKGRDHASFSRYR